MGGVVRKAGEGGEGRGVIGWAEVLMLFVGSVWIVATVACALSCFCEGVTWLWRKLT